jgi:hypothetical protein
MIMNKWICLCVVILCGCSSTTSSVALDKVVKSYNINGSANDIYSTSLDCLIDIVGAVPTDGFDYRDDERRRYSLRILFKVYAARFGYSENHRSTLAVKVLEDNKIEISERNVSQWNDLVGFWDGVYEDSRTADIVNARVDIFADCIRDNI